LERFVLANSRVVVDYDFQAQMGRERALGGVERAVRELAANIMRVVNGTGRPEMIGPQAQALVNAMDAHRSIAGCAPSPNEIADVLNIVAKAERVALLNLEREAEMRATQNLMSRALPIAASRLNEIRSHTPGGVEGLTPDDYTVGPSPAWGA
jgi:coenzyme F420-reducing hydrogenase gamma subunit